jgi:hypothetical protein
VKTKKRVVKNITAAKAIGNTLGEILASFLDENEVDISRGVLDYIFPGHLLDDKGLPKVKLTKASMKIISDQAQKYVRFALKPIIRKILDDQ